MLQQKQQVNKEQPKKQERCAAFTSKSVEQAKEKTVLAKTKLRVTPPWRRSSGSSSECYTSAEIAKEVIAVHQQELDRAKPQEEAAMNESMSGLKVEVESRREAALEQEAGF